MKWSDIDFDPPEKMLRQFAALCLVVLVGLAVWRFVGRGDRVWAAVLGAAGLGVGVAGLVRPRNVRPVFVGAMVAALPVGWLASWVVPALVYYGLFTPLAVAFRLAGRDPLKRRGSRLEGSYWEPKPSPVDAGRYLRQY
jgi:hypothetical protein